jgi:DNA-binding transcriptional LysR family regulator
MELSDIDLNQLVLFQQLMVERSVSKVAEKLGLTQPAVSNTLAKLRRQFGDDLFVRTPTGMMPTPFAEQLAEPIGYALGMIHSGLNQQSRFDPASVKRSVTIGMTDIGEIVFLPALVERLRQQAPGVSLSTVRTTATTLRDDMEAGKVDLAIGPLPQLKAGFFQRRLFQQRYVCLFRQGHALDRKVDDLIRRAGVDRSARLTIPHYVSVGHLLRRSDMLATVTERLAESLVEPFDLTYRPHPIDLPEIAINVFWHAKVHRSPAHQWLRGVVFDLFGEDKASNPTSSKLRAPA